MTKDCLLILFVLSFWSLAICAQAPDKQNRPALDRSSATIPTPIHGVTVADNKDVRNNKYLNEVLESVGHLTSVPTVRLTYKLEGSDADKGAKAATYLSAAKAIARKAYIFAEVVDSAYEFCFSLADHEVRWKDYVSTLGDYVDVWEVGNEINGNWLDNSDPIPIKGQTCPWKIPNTTDKDVVAKMINAYHIVKKAGKTAALTLYYEPNPACTTSMRQQYDPIAWATQNIPAEMKAGLDYVLLSYYRDKCLNFKPDLGALFTEFHNIFPNAKLGMGEWGYSVRKPDHRKLTELLNEGYSFHPDVPNWIGGVFFWEFGTDAVPYDPKPGSIWSLINSDLSKQ
ncbi:MAG TPA: hypothetical protein VMG82_20630 [Candidatus Sulfotelmatobacter sp.]|nr:hypothetical protein [Candidatus Sulfotelmatobacter sp.]